jgi:GT2 family glycosyltransferase/glycosyltransferase involved in cell wall biosynthesis/SAM-dependent methyltransferase/uncharacterized protein YbaR (Trm112 family)
MDLNISDINSLAAETIAPLFWRPSRVGYESAWTAHVPFAFWLVASSRPRLLVELGTHHGVSYAAFCDAVLREQLDTRCYAVDTWKGDPQAGGYGEEVFNDLLQFNEAHFGSFSELMRCSFDEAVDFFRDGTIDLLHIDGYHSYDAVKADFERWRPKCSDRAIILFHDSNERAGTFGVWKLFAELAEIYPHFEFLHQHGLGLIMLGTQAPASVAALCNAPDYRTVNIIRERFALLGERWHLELRVRLLEAQAKVQAAQQNELGEYIQTLRNEADGLRMAAQARDHALEQATREGSELLASVAMLRADLAGAQALAATEREMRLRAAGRAAAARQDANALRMQLAGNSAGGAAGIEGQFTWPDAPLHATRLELARVRAERDAFAASTSWRLTAPIRGAMGRAPGLRRLARKTAKLAWWGVTLQLPKRLSARRALIDNATLIANSGLFDPAWYRGRYPDVAARGIDPLYHYLTFGGGEGRDPSPRFNTRLYTEKTPGLKEAGINPLVHYLRHSAGQGSFAPAPAALPSAQPQRAAALAAPVAANLPAGRLIYISGEPHTPGHIYRVAHYAAAARSLGIESLVLRLEDALAVLPALRPQDITVIWRASWDDTVAGLVARATEAGAKLIFDLDDVVINPDFAQSQIIDGIRSQGIPEAHVRAQFQRFHQTMLSSEFCTAATETLAREVRQFHKTCFVLPNTFDDRVYARSRLAARAHAAARDGLLRIGYAGGSKTHQKDFLLVADVLAEVLRARPESRLVLFRVTETNKPLVEISEYPALAKLAAQIEWRELVPLTELPSEIARFDVNLAPLETGNRFCEAKSELKYFEAAITGVCTIASPTAPFRAAIRHGENGFLATSPAEWAACLNRLLDDPELRREMARCAQHDALVQFGPIAARKALASLLDQTRGGEPAARAFQLEIAAPSRPQNPIAVPASRQVFISDRLGQAQVTVIIPLYNYAGYVIEALESVRAQTLQPLDLIIVDDGSTDESLQRAVAWATQHAARFNRVLVLQNEQNAGLGPTRNVAFDAAETMFVLPLDADNRLLPECCEQLLAKLAGTGASYAYPTIRKFGGSSDLIGPRSFHAKRFAGEPYIDAMALVRKDAWASARGYADMRAGWEDYDFWCRLAEQGLWGIGSDLVLAEYRVHKQSMLATTTDQLATKHRVLRDLERRHPWVYVVNRPPVAVAPAAAALPRPLRPALRTLLPILRCPVTHQPLVMARDGTLKTADGGRSWPVIDGRPILFPGMPNPAVMAEGHLSNALEEDALRLIDATAGLVLNLSAGGTANGNAKVVEVEAAVFRNTALVADAHTLPFVDESFGAVIAMNAFEHYRDPVAAAAEIMRVLRPGGVVLIRTAFLQPLHEKPWHFFNCTKYGMLEWFREFELQRIHVSANFTPNYAIAWLLSDAEQALRRDVSEAAASAFAQAPIGRFVDFWRDAAERSDPLWSMFAKLGPDSQEALAAGFEYVGKKAETPRAQAAGGE